MNNVDKELLFEQIELYVHTCGNNIKLRCLCCKHLTSYTEISNNQKKKSYKKIRCNNCINVYKCKNKCNIILHTNILKTYDIISIIYEYCGNTTNFIYINTGWPIQKCKLYTMQCGRCKKKKYIDEYSKHQCKDRTRGYNYKCKKCVYQFNRFSYYFKKNIFQQLKTSPLETVFFDRLLKKK